MIYDLWILQGPGGPYDDGMPPTEYERAAEAFAAMPPRTRARERRLNKRSTRRRLHNPAWRARQRREDINAQAVY